MFGFMKKKVENQPQDAAEQDRLAESVSEKIRQLEAKLASNTADTDTQKQLMLEYNRALSLYAKSRRYRDHIDPLFVKIDELRNLVRKSV
ncbi:hypothetical protein C7434_1127 [Pantoea sp. PNA 14-12]|uniref:hypothetical protein n=1 Tax=Pantoea TaxID=53335 RepID=UPI0005435221|nr:hypothetical protein [Pantoea]KKW49865.1 hypothetical protein XB02_15625 [Pantoea ananatis]KHE02286.1 hypothetical protein NL54_06000 [Pantoea stewartii]KHN61731.1 hypothetical protein OI73_12725 [Pantoea stewartii]MDK2634726.1 hypothetical protein [Pantoea stewartii subsp. indologenes]MEB6534141.1 hypothetical protein [Pantoea stewartii]